MKHLSIFWAVLLCVSKASAQYLSPQVLNSTGNTVALKTIEFSWSVGETNITTLSSPNIILTQGFLQPDMRISKSDIEMGAGFSDINVFPNPVHDQLFISKNGNPIQSLSLYNALGQKIMEQNTGIPSLDFSQLRAGIYYLNLSSNDLAEVHTFKIIKY